MVIYTNLRTLSHESSNIHTNLHRACLGKAQRGESLIRQRRKTIVEPTNGEKVLLPHVLY